MAGLNPTQYPGQTYFIQAGTGGPVKIGYTTVDLRTRLGALQTGCPAPLKVLGAISGNCERWLHIRFRHIRERGEWFSATSELLAVALANDGIIEGFNHFPDG